MKKRFAVKVFYQRTFEVEVEAIDLPLLREEWEEAAIEELYSTAELPDWPVYDYKVEEIKSDE